MTTYVACLEQGVKDLRQRFVDKSRDDYVFKPAYHKRIPADGVAFYMEGIWEQVQTNKDLDLPTQQELLAQFRCDEISAVALSEFIVLAITTFKTYRTIIAIRGFSLFKRGTLSQVMFNNGDNISTFEVVHYTLPI